MNEPRTQTIRIEIAPKSIFLILGVLIGLSVLYSIRSVLSMTFIALIISSAAFGPINSFISKGLPKWLSVTLVYSLFLLAVVALFSLISVPFAKQTARFFQTIPDFFESFAVFINQIAYGLGASDPLIQTGGIDSAFSQLYDYTTQNLDSIVSAGTQGVTGAVKLLAQLFGGIFSLFSIIVISVYITYDRDGIVEEIKRHIPDKSIQTKIDQLVEDIEHKLGGWLRGQFTLSLCVGFLSWIALSLLRLPYSLPIACLTGVMTNIPVFGATFSVVLPIIVALATGNLLQVLGVILAYIGIQQFENHILIPKIMSSAVGIRPLIIILALLVGAELFGIIGVLLAVPVAGVIQLGIEFALDLRANNKQN